jgi:phosphatidylglycerol---prolipoprotein diacylglyceryl transferase
VSGWLGAAMPQLAVIAYPHIDPVALRLGPVQIRWYGLAYVAAFVAAGFVMAHLNKRWKLGLSTDDQMSVLLGSIIGIVVGGRLGYVLFYDPAYFIAHPLRIPATWYGGMSFHGGLVGILIAGWILSRRLGVSFLTLTDIGAIGAPVGIFLGRIANFVNGELWGRPTDVPWAMVFPGAGPAPRHPSQLYEAVLEGLVIFAVMWWLSRTRRPEGTYLGLMLTMYAVFRIFLEQFREPDAQLGTLFGGVTMGQLLSVPVFVAGVWLLVRAGRSAKRASG